MNGILQLSRNTLIQHPNGGYVFGVIPALSALSHPVGSICLKAGFHRGKSGFGVSHIWAGKKSELRHVGCAKPDDIPAFIASLIVSGADVYHDPNHHKASKSRVTILRFSSGTLTLEPINDRNLGFIYSIVTWTPRTTARGVLVGNVA